MKQQSDQSGCVGCAYAAGWVAGIFANLWGGAIIGELIFGPPEGVTDDGYPFVFLWWLPLLGAAMLFGLIGGIGALKAGVVKKAWAIALIVLSLVPALAFVGLIVLSAVTGAF